MDTTCFSFMEPEFDRGNLKIPEMFADWLATTGGSKTTCLPFLDESSFGGIPSVQTMWSLTAQRCSELQLTSLSKICRIKARSTLRDASSSKCILMLTYLLQISVSSIRYFSALFEKRSIKTAKYTRKKHLLSCRCGYDFNRFKTETSYYDLFQLSSHFNLECSNQNDCQK